jgi:ankyrin repeat protein
MSEEIIGICYPFHYAVRFNDIILLQKCIENSNNINIQDHNNNTPLHLAYMLNRTDFISILLNNGADNNLLNDENKKPSEMV